MGAALRPHRTAIRRRVGVAIAVIGIAAAVVVQASPASAAPSRPVDTDYNTYVLFAETSLHFKSGNAAVSQISGGNIGVNAANGQLNACGGGGLGAPMHMDDESQVVANTVKMQEACDVWDVFANTLTGNPTIRNSGPEPITTFPIVTNAPVLPQFDCNQNFGTQTLNGPLAPGSYGFVNIPTGGTLNLSDGTYTFCSLNVNGERLVTSAGTIIQIEERMVAGNGSNIGGACEAKFFIENRNLGGNSNFGTSTFGRNSFVEGRFWAPNGDINLGHSTTLHGSFGSLNILSDFNVNVSGCNKPVITTTTSTTATSVAPSSVTASTVPITTEGDTTVIEAADELPATGGDSGTPMVAGLALVAGGVLLAFAGGRRHRVSRRR